MLLSYSKIISLPVVDLQNRIKVGTVSDIIIDKNSLKVAALIVNAGNFFWPKKTYVCWPDIVHVLKEAVVVTDENSANDLTDLPKIGRLISEKCYGLNQTVETESGKNIGRVFDYLIDSLSGHLAKIYVKNIFNERIIPVTKIIEFTGRKFIIKNDKTAIKSKSSSEPVTVAE